MKSFKKIALAMVATVGLSTIGIGAANASVTTTLLVGGSPVATGTLVNNPTLIPVPADNVINSADTMQISVAGLAAATNVTASVSNGRIVSALTTPSVPVTASSGTNVMTINTGTGSTADFFVYTTSVAGSSVSVTIGANTTTYYFKGVAGPLNSIVLSAPSTAASGTVERVSVAAFDVFGNAKGGEVISLQVITTTSTTSALITDVATTATTILGTKTADIAIPTSGTVTLVATASVAPAYIGLPAPVGVVIRTITVRDLVSELAAEKAGRAADKVAADKALADAKAASDKALADAKIASDKAIADALAAAKTVSDKAIVDLQAAHKLEMDLLIAQNAATIKSMKTAFNSLAKKWNAKNPKSKVTLVK